MKYFALKYAGKGIRSCLLFSYGRMREGKRQDLTLEFLWSFWSLLLI